MKEGDKLYCKKDCIDSYNGKVLFKEGEYYRIIKTNIPICVKCESGFVPFYSLTNKNDECLWKYFLSPKEERKLKLDKINGIDFL